MFTSTHTIYIISFYMSSISCILKQKILRWVDIAQDFEKDYPVYRSFLKIRTAISTVKKNDIKTKRIELLKIITLLVTV